MKLAIRILGGTILVLLALVVLYYFNVKVSTPEVELETPIEVEKVSTDYLKASNGSWLRNTGHGAWEMYLTGDPYELGVTFGKLTEDLSEKREEAFISEIQSRIPSKSYLNFLKYLVAWFNRDLDEYVPLEYQQEIYGSSAYMPDEFDFVGPKYQRALSYHAAHDIGHMLQNMNLVGCTSMAAWGDKSVDGDIVIGRNFDFYFGQDFAKDPIVAFYNPSKGFQFMSITWSGFSGVVSGMNEKGLTITLNAAKSDFPLKGKTPVSIIAREILQYASTIDEAFEMAKSHESFIAETFLIGSKEDGKVGLIEKSPDTTALYFQGGNEIIATNHFQSDGLKEDPLNVEYLNEGVSDYRYNRVQQLMDSTGVMNEKSILHILRDKKGMNGEDIGLANEKSINQLIAHHSVIFSPNKMLVWVSTPPYNLGNYLAYDLGEIFSHPNQPFTFSDSLSFQPDTYLTSGKYSNYDHFMKVKEQIQQYFFNGNDPQLTEEDIQRFVQYNPHGYLSYYYAGDYLKAHKQFDKAKSYYQKGLELVIAKESERQHMENGLLECEQNLNSND